MWDSPKFKGDAVKPCRRITTGKDKHRQERVLPETERERDVDDEGDRTRKSVADVCPKFYSIAVDDPLTAFQPTLQGLRRFLTYLMFRHRNTPLTAMHYPKTTVEGNKRWERVTFGV